MKAKPTDALALLLMLYALPGKAQGWPETERGVVAGLNYSRYLFGELGYYRSSVRRMDGLAVLSPSMSYGAEVSSLQGLVLAPKVQARMYLFFLNVSVATVLYTDFTAVSPRLRPEIGFGSIRYDLNYGYNAPLLNHDNFNKLNRHVFTLRCYLPVWKRS